MFCLGAFHWIGHMASKRMKKLAEGDCEEEVLITEEEGKMIFGKSDQSD